MPPSAAAARRPLNGVDQNRRASGRQVRTSISRPTNYYARPFGSIGGPVDEVQDDDPPGFFPAIQAFSDTIAALPKEVQRHITLSKEAEAKIHAPVQSMVQIADRISALPPPPRTHTLAARQAFLTFTANNSTGPNSASNSILNGSVPGFVPPSVAEAVTQLSAPTPAEQQAELQRRQEFYNLRMTISQILTHLDEKNVCLADANRTLDKQLGRIDKIMPHIHSEISEEARLGSTSHWAYADNRKKNMSAQAPEQVRRNVAATSSLAAAAAVIHESDIAAARSGKDTKKNRAQHLDSEFEERGPQKRAQNKGKRAADNTDLKPGPAAAGSAQPPKKRRVEKTGGIGMERTASTTKNAKATTNTNAARSVPAVEPTKKKSKPAVPSLSRKKNGTHGSPAHSPQNAGSPVMANFAVDTNGQRPSSRARQSSSSLIHSKLAREASSAREKKTNGIRKSALHETSDAMGGIEQSLGNGAGTDDDTKEPDANDSGRGKAEKNGMAPTSNPDHIRPLDSVEMFRTRSNGPRHSTDGLSTHVSKSSAARNTEIDNGQVSSVNNNYSKKHGRSSSSQHILKQIASFNRSPTMGRRELPSGTDESSTNGDDEPAASSSAARPRRNHRGLSRQTSRLRSAEVDEEEEDDDAEDEADGTPANRVEDENKNGVSSRGSTRRAQRSSRYNDEVVEPEITSRGRSRTVADAEEPEENPDDTIEMLDDDEQEIPVQPQIEEAPTRDIVEEEEEEDGEEGEPKYCYCERESFGTMIGCENDDCPRQWFHLSCVGMSKPPEDNVKWYCDYCIDGSRKKKGRNGGRH